MRTKRTDSAEKDNIFFRLTIFQLVICAVVFGLLFGVMKLNPDLFDTLKSAFSELMEQDFDLREITFFPPQDPQAATDVPIQETTQERENNSDETQTTETVLPEEDVAVPQAAGGEDMADADALRLVSFAVYDTGDTPVLPVQGKITSDFGERIHPIYGTAGFHSGRDIAAAEGTPVYAALDGVVIAAGTGEKSGNYIKIDHGDGIETLYCHCSRLNVETGVTVRKGDVIAFVGQTGLATGPHLHFEVHVNGAVCNPDYLLENACSVF